jgi:hypothetical protein
MVSLAPGDSGGDDPGLTPCPRSSEGRMAQTTPVSILFPGRRRVPSSWDILRVDDVLRGTLVIMVDPGVLRVAGGRASMSGVERLDHLRERRDILLSSTGSDRLDIRGLEPSDRVD